MSQELKNGWRGTSTSFLINSATICPLHSSFISLKYQLACSYSFFACVCVCVSTTCLESKLYILQCARSIGVTASETRAQKWMARHVNIISSQFRNYLFSPLKLRVTKVPTCMFFFILCLHLSTTCLESKLYIFSVPDRLVSQRLKPELKNGWRGTSTSFLINSATICALHSSSISLKYPLACSHSFFACPCQQHV